MQDIFHYSRCICATQFGLPPLIGQQLQHSLARHPSLAAFDLLGVLHLCLGAVHIALFWYALISASVSVHLASLVTNPCAIPVSDDAL
jgi:hypothetical protein